MASLIEGYEYDIFISYRQKDNRYDSWVTTFVDNLKRELEATLKDDISIYFDENPHDGLLETHSVNKSLEGKLRCLIFIPVISQTYCDSKSYAWQHEFCAFNKLANEDQFGRDIRLTNGNVASRILPVKIHDIDPEDKTLLENELGEVLRSVEFIYKSAGVNRPLRANEDHPQDNLNKIYYRDQINKVANAVKEIITAIKKYGQEDEEVLAEVTKAIPLSQKNLKAKIIKGSLFVLALIVLGYFFIPKLFQSSEQVEKSIAVLPFKLLSDVPDKQYLADGMMDAITLHLSKIRDLRVVSRTTVEQYRNTTKTVPQIGKELGVEYLLEGSFQEDGGIVRLIVQLIKASEESHVWADQYDRNWKEVFVVQSEVAQAIASKLHAIITPEEKMIIKVTPTSDMTAYNYYLRGKDYYNRSFSDEDQRYAIQMYEKAIAIDSSFALAWAGLATSSRILFNSKGDRSENNLSMTKKYLDKALSLAPESKEAKIEEVLYYEHCKNDYLKALQILETLKIQYPNDEYIDFGIGLQYRRIGEVRKSLDYLNHAISLNPAPWKYWWNAAISLTILRDYSNAEKYVLQAIDLNPSNLSPYGHLFNLYVLHGQIQKAREFLKSNEKSFDSKALKISQAQLALISRNYKEAIEITQSISEDLINVNSPFFPLNLGLIYRAMHNNAMAVKHFETERNILLGRINESGNNWRYYELLGIAYAGLGMKEHALEAGKKALDIANFDIDKLEGFHPEMNMVRILVMVEEYDEAMIRLDKVIKNHGFISVEILNLDPFWDSVRNNEKFKEIVNNPEYQVRISN